MRDNTIIDKLRRTFDGVRDETGRQLPFVYEDRDIQNILVGRIAAPLILCVPLTSTAIIASNGLLKERMTLAVWFADRMAQGSGDYCAEDNERVIDVCKQRAFGWGARLTPQNELRLVSVNGAERAYLETDENLTGYMLNVTLEEVQGYGCNGIA